MGFFSLHETCAVCGKDTGFDKRKLANKEYICAECFKNFMEHKPNAQIWFTTSDEVKQQLSISSREVVTPSPVHADKLEVVRTEEVDTPAMNGAQFESPVVCADPPKDQDTYHATQRETIKDELSTAPVNKKKVQTKIIIVAACSVLLLFCTYQFGRSAGHAQMLTDAERNLIEEQNIEYRTTKTNLDSINKELSASESKLKEFESYQLDVVAANKTLSDLQAKVSELQTSMQTAQTTLEAKQKELDLVTANVTKASGSPKYLPAGFYTVGDHIPAGRYIITGKSNLFIRDSSGSARINTILGSKYGVPEYIATISNGMTIQTEGGATFTPTAN